MKEITRYESPDGNQFNTVAECKRYETLCGTVEAILGWIPNRPDCCDFSNGGGYIQHDKKTFIEFKNALLDLIGKRLKHKWVEETKSEDRHVSHLARLLDDSGESCLQNAWQRIYCTDKKYREWGQPFYVNNPEKGTQKRLNP